MINIIAKVSDTIVVIFMDFDMEYFMVFCCLGELCNGNEGIIFMEEQALRMGGVGIEGKEKGEVRNLGIC